MMVILKFLWSKVSGPLSGELTSEFTLALFMVHFYAKKKSKIHEALVAPPLFKHINTQRILISVLSNLSRRRRDRVLGWKKQD